MSTLYFRNLQHYIYTFFHINTHAYLSKSNHIRIYFQPTKHKHILSSILSNANSLGMIKRHRSPNVIKAIPPMMSFLWYLGSTCSKLYLNIHFIISILLLILNYTVLFHSFILHSFTFLTCISISPFSLRVYFYHPFSISNLCYISMTC